MMLDRPDPLFPVEGAGGGGHLGNVESYKAVLYQCNNVFAGFELSLVARYEELQNLGSLVWYSTSTAAKLDL